MQSGGAFESKDNQIVLNGSKATMQWESSFPANVVNEKMTDEQAQELLKQTKAQGEVRIDKKFIRESYKAFMNISGTPVDDAQLEQVVQGFEKGILELNNSEFKDAVQAKADGGQLVITLTKEAGKLPASLEKPCATKHARHQRWRSKPCRSARSGIFAQIPNKRQPENENVHFQAACSVSSRFGQPEKQFEIVVDLKFVNGWLLISPCGGADLLM